MPGLHAIEPPVVIVSQYWSRARHSGPLADDADLEDALIGQLSCTPERVLPITGKALTGGGAPRLRIPDSLGELLEQALAASSVWPGSVRSGIQDWHDISPCGDGEKAQAQASKETRHVLPPGTP